MKKLTSLLLMLVFLFSCASSAKALTPEDSTLETSVDKSTFTVEYLSQSTWESLSQEIFDKTLNSKEDELVVNWVQSLLNPQVEQVMQYYHFGFAVTNNFDRLMDKSIIVSLLFDAYNTRDELDVVPWVTENGSIFFSSFNTGLIDSPVTTLGQHALFEPDSIYWEDSQYNGNHGVIAQENPYILASHLVIVDGVSYVDEDGNIESYSFEDGLSVDSEKSPMLHITSGNGYDLGWIEYHCVKGLW